MTQVMKRHDTAPAVELAVYESDGTTPKDLSGGAAKFSLGARTYLPYDVVVPALPIVVVFPDLLWVQTIRVGDAVRIESNAGDELLTVSTIDYQTGEVTFDRGIAPCGFYRKGSAVWFLKVLGIPAEITGTSNNILKYQWQFGDTDRTGLFWGEFEVIDSFGFRRTYPANDYVGVRIIEDIDDQ